MKATLFFALTLAAITVESTYAHHALLANYYFDRTVTVEGKVDEFLLRNPHSFVRVAIADAAGHVETWLLEWGSGSQLGRTGVSEDTLRAGDSVIVTAHPSRKPAERKLRVVTMVRPSDGWTWSEDSQ